MHRLWVGVAALLSVAPFTISFSHTDSVRHNILAPAPVVHATSAAAHSAPHAAAAPQKPQSPLGLIIPSIALNSPIKDLGINSKGEMDVPSGATKDTGWYAAGTVPGELGSAVLDAHVFAAFARLNELKVGSDIYIIMSGGQTLHFIVSETDTYPLADVPAQKLFNRDDAKRLNLITCAGALTPDHSTYDHRLVVYAVLAGASPSATR